MILTLLLALTLGQAAPKAATYDVAFVLAQGTYTGVTTFAVDKDGTVSGTLKITEPGVVDATLAGTVKDGVWTIDHTYSMPAQGCTGTIKGTAKVPKDGKVIEGKVVIGGGCAETPLDATFTFTRK